MPRLAACFAASLTTAAVMAVPTVLAPATADAAAVVHQRVTAKDLGPRGPWLRLQDNPSNAGRPAGVQEVSPFADPVRFNGSLHLALAAAPEAQQAQAAHYFSRLVPLITIGANPLSYDLFVRAWTSTASAIPFGANMQLPGFCQGTFTTLSFQPQLATDAQGRSGAVADTWRHFDTGGAALWRTSQAVGSFAAGSDHPFSDYATACNGAHDGATGVIANVGRLGDASTSLDTYVDNLTVNGTVYDFTVRRTAVGRIDIEGSSSGAPGKPGTWNASDKAAVPAADAAFVTGGRPGTPGAAGKPDTAGTPEAPGGSEAGGRPGVAGGSEAGGKPGIAGGSDAAGKPETQGGSDAAAKPGAPGKPGGPGEPCKPGKPGGSLCRVEGVITFTSPADGPYYGSVGTRLVFSRPGGLDPHNLTVTANGQPVTLAGSPDGTVTAVVTPPTDADLGPRGTYRTTFTVACADPEAGPVAVTAELLAQGYRPLRPTGVIASADAR